MILIRHLAETSDSLCFRRTNNTGTLKEAHARIDQLENLVNDLIKHIRDRRGRKTWSNVQLVLRRAPSRKNEDAPLETLS